MQGIDLTTFFFTKKKVPSTLKLSECGLPFKYPLADDRFFSGLYGQSKLTALSDAVLWARTHGEELVVIDVRVELPREILKSRRPTLTDFETTGMVSTQHTTREALAHLAQCYWTCLNERGLSKALQRTIDLENPATYMRFADQVPRLLTDFEPWDKLPALVYPTEITVSEPRAMVATVRRSEVVLASATARFTPGVSIEIDL